MAKDTTLALVQPCIGGFWNLVYMVLAPLTSLVSFGVIYKMLPEAQLACQEAWFSALFTALLFSLGKYGRGVYLGNNGAESSFGVAGSIMALLLWVYYSAQIFFFGAKFTRQYTLLFGSLPAPLLTSVSP